MRSSRLVGGLTALVALLWGTAASASEAALILPDFAPEQRTLLMAGLVVCVLGAVFGLAILGQLKRMPVHRSMSEISELIYETCKTYLVTQGKFILLLEVLIGGIMVVYFSQFAHDAKGEPLGAVKVGTILLFSLIGIAGSYGVAWFGIRVNTYANSRAAFGALAGKPWPAYEVPIKAGMSIGTLLISTELVIMLGIILFMPPDYAGPCFIGFAIGESLGASALRIAGGIFTKIADIGSDLMKIVFNIKEDDARNPGVIADCTGDNAGDSVGPSADGFETYGVTGVALIAFILLAVPNVTLQAQLLTWIFVMRIAMIGTSVFSYFINQTMAKSKYGSADEMNFEAPLTILVWLTSFVSIGATYGISYWLIGDIANGMWWKLSTIITCGTIAGALIPEIVKVFTSTESIHVREVVTASKEGGASLNVLAGLTAGNFSAYWLGMIMVMLMGVGYAVSNQGLSELMVAPSVFAFGLVAFGFLGMGPVTIAVDSYGPVTDNAQSVYELSVIENIPGIEDEIQRDFGFRPQFERAKHHLESNDGAGNTFKATAKPVLIGTAVVGAATLIFSIILVLGQEKLGGIRAAVPTLASIQAQLDAVTASLSLLNPNILLGIITGGAIIYWFTGASTQAVVTGSYRAVEFIKQNIKLDDSVEKASIEDSKKVVQICTEYAQKGMLNIFLTLFFSTIAFAFYDEYFFIGYLVSIAVIGLYQALFMANAGGAWDNAKKLVEVELKAKNTPLHAAAVVGDTVGDPFKDTSSVALNPVIKFTTLFGLLAVELAIQIEALNVRHAIAAFLFVVSAYFVHRSFYGMRIGSEESAHKA
jgi:K(+)-stimulated pyrophosphate-energized sodium pump